MAFGSEDTDPEQGADQGALGGESLGMPAGMMQGGVPQPPPKPGIGPGKHLLTGLVGVLIDGLQAGLQTPQSGQGFSQSAGLAAQMPEQRQQKAIALASQALQLKAQLAQSHVQDLQTKLLASKLDEEMASGLTNAGWEFYQQALKNGTAKMVSGESPDAGTATAKQKEIHDSDPDSSLNTFVGPGIKKGTWGVWQISPKNALQEEMNITIPGNKDVGGSVEDKELKIPAGTDMGTAKVLASQYFRDQAAKIHADMQDPKKATGEEGAYQQAVETAKKAGQPEPSRLTFHKQWEAANVKPTSPDKIDARADKSYQYNQTRVDKLRAPLDTLAARFSRLQEAIDQNSPTADALIMPELMVTMAGGQGSGIRITDTEINRLVDGRSNWEKLKASANKWAIDPQSATSITPAQRQQIRKLVQAVGEKMNAKKAVLDDAEDKLLAADSPQEHRRVVADLQKQLSAVDSGKFPDRETANAVRKATGDQKSQKFDWGSLPAKQQ
jgi:hypothetical protein